MSNGEDLLHAETPEGVAFRENGLRNLEAMLRAKTDWESPHAYAKAMLEFQQLASALRSIDAMILLNHWTQG